jgi:hypothetical protein
MPTRKATKYYSGWRMITAEDTEPQKGRVTALEEAM